MAFLNALGLSQDALKKDLWKTPNFHVYLSNVCLMTYKKSGNHFLSFKMSNMHNIRSQPNLGVLQTSDSACAPLKFKLSKWKLPLKNMNITKKHWVLGETDCGHWWLASAVMGLEMSKKCKVWWKSLTQWERQQCCHHTLTLVIIDKWLKASYWCV